MAVRSHKQQTLCLEQAGAFDRVSAPMVMASELPWRLLLRCFGVTLCYTPMIDAQEYVQCEASARHTLLQTRQYLFPHPFSIPFVMSLPRNLFLGLWWHLSHFRLLPFVMPL
jgi:hypothetical protein